LKLRLVLQSNEAALQSNVENRQANEAAQQNKRVVELAVWVRQF